MASTHIINVNLARIMTHKVERKKEQRKGEERRREKKKEINRMGEHCMVVVGTG